jgi:hypothetical protein
MEKNENIFILEWGYSKVKLVYSVIDGADQVVRVDVKCCDNDGSSLDNEKDLSRVEKILNKLLDYFEKKYNLKIQTLYLLYRGYGCVVRHVKEKQPYEEFLEQRDKKNPKLKNLPERELPLHCDLFSVFDKFSKSSETEGIAFAIHSNERDMIQKALLQRECFIEGFISWSSLIKEGMNQVFLNLDEDGSILFSSYDNKLASYREFDFSLNTLRDEIVDKINLEKEQALKCIRWVIRPPSVEDKEYYKNADADLFRSEEFGNTRNLIADELEHFMIAVRQHLEECGIWDQGIKNLVLLGEGGSLISRYTFIKEILPFSFQLLNQKYSQFFEEKKDLSEFSVLFHLLPACYSRRVELRKRIEESQKKYSLRDWSRRILGR